MARRTHKQLKQLQKQMAEDARRAAREQLAEAAEKVVQRNRKAAQIGAAIPGSKLVRDFCACCGEAIRVTYISQKNFCLECMNTEDGMGISLDEAARHDDSYHGDRFYSGEW